MTKRPRRQHKSDRLMAPDANTLEVECDHILAPFDRVAREMERKWGIDRLPELVSVETAQRWGRTMGRLNEAIREANRDELMRLVPSAIRGLHVMDAEAEAAGKPALNLWEYDLDGFRFAIIEDNRRWQEVKAQRPDLVTFTMREAALALQMFHEAGGGFLAETKKAFPGAEAVKASREITSIPDSFFEAGGDPIPF